MSGDGSHTETLGCQVFQGRSAWGPRTGARLTGHRGQQKSTASALIIKARWNSHDPLYGKVLDVTDLDDVESRPADRRSYSVAEGNDVGKKIKQPQPKQQNKEALCTLLIVCAK